VTERVPAWSPLHAFVCCSLLLLTAAAFLVRPARAQVVDAWLHYTPLDAYAGQASTRLRGMGAIEVAAWDDQARIDSYGYGRNPAGLLRSRDSSVVETPFSYGDFEDQYYGQSHSAVQRGAAGHGEFRPGGKWAIGVDIDYSSVTASRFESPCPTPDDCRFFRDFDLPVSPNIGPETQGRTFGAGVRTPWLAVSYAREFFDGVTLGARFGYRHENEDRRVLDPYDLDVTSDATELTGGASWVLPVGGRSASLSAWAQYVEHSVVGKSESPLNEDEYDWNRPQVAYGAALHIRKGTWLNGIIDGRHRSHDGEEIARINWAPQFYMNPFPSDTDPNNVFNRTWSAFLSGLRHNEASTRWMIGIPDIPVRLGLRYGYFRQYEWIRANEVVLPTVNELDVKRQGYRFAGGLSLDLPDKSGVVATEVRIAREFREDFTNVIDDLSYMTYTYHFGAEYRITDWLPARAGVQLIHHDPNREDGIAPLEGAGLTLGAGYFWTALQWRIDASYEHYNFRSQPLDPAEEIGFGDRVSLFIQRAF
jgi:hypothetical protein